MQIELDEIEIAFIASSVAVMRALRIAHLADDINNEAVANRQYKQLEIAIPSISHDYETKMVEDTHMKFNQLARQNTKTVMITSNLYTKEPVIIELDSNKMN